MVKKGPPLTAHSTSVAKESPYSEKPSQIDNEIAEISQRILVELETASSMDLSEAKYAKKILQLSDLNYTHISRDRVFRLELNALSKKER